MAAVAALAFFAVRSLGPPPPIPKIDVHVHVGPRGMPLLRELMDRNGIAHAVNLSGMWSGHGLEQQLAAAQTMPGRVSVFCNLDFRNADRQTFGSDQVRALRQAHNLGARGLKVPKGLGIGYRWNNGYLILVDDEALDPIWDEAGRLGMPVLIHTGDPKKFWEPPTPDNERYDELRVHPGWSFAGQDVPPWNVLFEQFVNVVRRHPKTTFIGAHFGNDPEDPEAVARLLDELPNFYVDTAARVPELGRHPAATMHDILTRHADRILFGTDLGVGDSVETLMLGSTGDAPVTEADVARFFGATWRWFETRDRQFDHPTPIQGRWKIDGVGLDRATLEKIYWKNAARLLRLPAPVYPSPAK